MDAPGPMEYLVIWLILSECQLELTATQARLQDAEDTMEKVAESDDRLIARRLVDEYRARHALGWTSP